MYIIKRQNRRFGDYRRFNNFVFDTYEAARKYCVKWLRKNVPVVSNYPTLRDGNFKIVRN